MGVGVGVGVCVVLFTIETLFDIAEATRLWAEDEGMSMFFPILREKEREREIWIPLHNHSHYTITLIHVIW